MHGFLIKSLLKISGSKIIDNFHKIKQYEKLDYESLKKLQEEKLKKLLCHSYESVKYYKDLFESIDLFKDGKLHFDNFSKLPILTKDIIRKQGDALYSSDKGSRNPYENSSGGSTGEPLKLIQDKSFSDWNIANKLYIKQIGGQNIGMPELRLWGSERDILESKEKLSIRLRNFLYNRKEFNSFVMDDGKLENLLSLFNRFKPSWIEAYVQSAYEFAKFIKKSGKNIHKPKAILTSAGTLYPEMKELISSVFDCPIYNRYGSREVGDMACNCEKDEGLHIYPWNHYFEILDEGNKAVPPGGKGKVYITALNNFSMPLIRYELGDIAQSAIQTKCSCGRPMPLIKNVLGRDVSLFKKKDGSMIDGEYFTHLFYGRAWCEKFQVIQKGFEKIEIHVIKRFDIVLKDRDDIDGAIKKVMGNDCKIIWKERKEIPPLKSGKYIYTYSEM